LKYEQILRFASDRYEYSIALAGDQTVIEPLGCQRKEFSKSANLLLDF